MIIFYMRVYTLSNIFRLFFLNSGLFFENKRKEYSLCSVRSEELRSVKLFAIAHSEIFARQKWNFAPSSQSEIKFAHRSNLVVDSFASLSEERKEKSEELWYL